MSEQNLTQEQIRGLQRRGFEMLIYFRDFCKEHDLMFYLCGGCCIGGMRDGKFIPWDDDVDVFMPRPDYERLARLWNRLADTEKYSYQAPTKAQGTRNQFATIHCNGSTFIKTYQQDLDINHGIMMDVIPLDGCPTGRFARKIQKFYALLYSLMIVEAAPENHGKAVEFLGKMLLFLIPGHRARFALAKRCERKMCRTPFYNAEKITELCTGPHYMQNEYPKACFAKQHWGTLEGEPMPFPGDYDTYMTMAFGDWHQLPPEEKRVIHHDYVKIEPDVPYLNYRGTLYAADNKTKK